MDDCECHMRNACELASLTLPICFSLWMSLCKQTCKGLSVGQISGVVFQPSHGAAGGTGHRDVGDSTNRSEDGSFERSWGKVVGGDG